MDELFRYAFEHPASDWAMVVALLSMFMLGFYFSKIFGHMEDHNGRIKLLEDYRETDEKSSILALERMTVIEKYIQTHESEACRRDDAIQELRELGAETRTLNKQFAKAIERLEDR